MKTLMLLKKYCSFFLLIFCLSALCFLPPVSAQNVESKVADDTTTIYLNKDGLTLDSLYSVVFDNKVSYEKKKALFDSSHIIKHPKIEAVYKRLLQDVKKTKDADKILNDYNNIVYYYDNCSDYENERLYLDSADEYVGKAKDPGIIAFYYYMKGELELIVGNDIEKAYLYFNTAIPYYEKINKYQGISRMMSEIAADAYNLEDTAALHKVRDQMASIALRFPDMQEAQYRNADIANSWYQLRYNQDGQQADLDSALSTGRRRIAILQRKNNKIAYIDIYQDFSLFLEKYRPEGWQTEVEGYLAKSRAVIENEKRDTVSFSVIQQLICEGALLTLTNHFAEAERKLSLSEKALQEYDDQAKETMSMDLYYWFTKLYEAKGDYKNALLYNEKKNEMQLSLRDGKISNMLARFNIQNKDLEIERQKVELVRRRRNNWIIGLSLAAAVILCFMWGYMYYRKARETKARLFAEKERSNAEKSQLLAEQKQLKAEQEKLKVENELQEERAANAELEKYEILSNSHLKDLELDGKNKELENLNTIKNNLDAEIENYRSQLAAYEAKEDEKTESTLEAEYSALCMRLKEEIREVILKELADKSGAPPAFILQSLDKIDATHLIRFRKQYSGSLSAQNMKYCICIAIGMNISELMSCFYIEQSSVHQMRYRLKKGFGLKSEDDLDTFLRQKI